jgi:hypothetical protein
MQRILFNVGVLFLISFMKYIFRIRIRIDSALLDLDPYRECGSGSRRKEIDPKTKITKKSDYQPCKMVLLPP